MIRFDGPKNKNTKRRWVLLVVVVSSRKRVGVVLCFHLRCCMRAPKIPVVHTVAGKLLPRPFQFESLVGFGRESLGVRHQIGRTNGKCHSDDVSRFA